MSMDRNPKAVAVFSKSCVDQRWLYVEGINDCRVLKSFSNPHDLRIMHVRPGGRGNNKSGVVDAVALRLKTQDGAWTGGLVDMDGDTDRTLLEAVIRRSADEKDIDVERLCNQVRDTRMESCLLGKIVEAYGDWVDLIQEIRGFLNGFEPTQEDTQNMLDVARFRSSLHGVKQARRERELPAPLSHLATETKMSQGTTFTDWHVHMGEHAHWPLLEPFRSINDHCLAATIADWMKENMLWCHSDSLTRVFSLVQGAMISSQQSFAEGNELPDHLIPALWSNDSPRE